METMEKLKKQKARTRKLISEKLGKYQDKRLREVSLLITNRITVSGWWKDAEAIFTYLSFKGEVETRPLIEQALHEGKTVAIPRITGDELIFYRVTSVESGLVENDYGILEPPHDAPAADPCAYGKTLVIVPGLAFDEDCNRLGRGKGFYDRYMASARSRCRERLMFIAPAFSFQVIERVPAGPGDERIDAIITESGAIRCFYRKSPDA